MRTIPLTNSDKIALVDDADYASVSQFSWWLHEGYVERSVPASKWRKQQCQHLHVFLLGKKAGRVTDHEDGNPLNNQRYNLRHATHSQNNANRHKTWGASQYKGVFWNSQRSKWHAQIYIDGQRIYLGVFVDERAAARAYDCAALECFREFARPNFPQQ